MAFVRGYGGKEDIWEEESLPNFNEIILQSNDQPSDGKIYLMYHGTTFSSSQSIIISGFHQSRDGMLGKGVYVSRNIDKALRYPIGTKSNQVVLKLRVNVGKVKKIDSQHHPLQKTWHDHGYDTAWVPAYCGMVGSGLEEDCVWDPKRIKVVGVARGDPSHIMHLNHLISQYAK